MKKLGIIGGAGPLASSLFYETLVYESYRKGASIPEIFLINYPFTRGLTIEERENGSRIQKELQYCFEMLEQAKADLGVIVCNTLHLHAISIKKTSVFLQPLPLFILSEIQRQNHQRLLLLATQNTCCSTLYHKIDRCICTPCGKEQKLVDEVIDRVLKGVILERDALLMTNLIARYADSVDGIILGCTDLPVLHHHFPLRSSKPIYDSVKLPAKLLLGLL